MGISDDLHPTSLHLFCSDVGLLAYLWQSQLLDAKAVKNQVHRHPYPSDAIVGQCLARWLGL